MHNNNEHDHRNHLQIWFCQHCDGVHLKTSMVTLDFTKKEFLALSDAMLGILMNEFSPEDLRAVSNFGAGNVDNDDVLLSKTIA